MLLDEFNEIARELEVHHGLFQRFWELGKPVFTDKVEVADVSYDKVGRTINFKINPEAWGKMTKDQKVFTIAHQCLHILLYHGFRISNLNKEEKKLADKALDIVNNHSLVNNFGFDRATIDPNNEMCWIDKVFPEPEKVQENRSFEYYYSLIKQQQQQQGDGDGEGEGKKGKGKPQKGKGGGKSAKGQPQQGGEPGEDEAEGEGEGDGEKDGETEHEGLETFCDEDFDDFMNEEVAEQASKEETEGVQEFVEKHTEDIKEAITKQAGTAPGAAFKQVKSTPVAKKKKWESVIQKWLKKTWNDQDIDQWSRRPRRMSCFSDQFFLPYEMETEEYENGKLNLWFFLDTSGSCAHLADRFFNAAMSVPNDKFNMKLFCFDTRCYEVSMTDKKLFGFGGTSFTCIEQYIQEKTRKDNCDYPNAVFLITDGYGDVVKPQYPGKWYWFLSEEYKHCIPKESPTFMLKDFE